MTPWEITHKFYKADDPFQPIRRAARVGTHRSRAHGLAGNRGCRIEAEMVLKTAIRISTFWWTLALLSAAIAPMRARADCGHPTIYRYEVRVAVHRETTVANDVDPPLPGTVKKLSDWKASWVAPISVEECPAGDWKIKPDPRTVAINNPSGQTDKGPDELHGGQLDEKFDWDNTKEEWGSQPQQKLDIPPCHFTFAGTAPAVMSLVAVYSAGTNSSNNYFGFTAWNHFTIGTKPDYKRWDDAERAACDPRRHGSYGAYPANSGLSSPAPIINGLQGNITDAHLGLDLSSQLTSSLSPAAISILGSLAAGNGFNFDTGTQLIQDEKGNSTRERATVSFTRSGSPSGIPSDSSPQTGQKPCDDSDYGMSMTYLSYCASYTQHYHPPSEEAALAAKMQQLSAQHEADRKRCGYSSSPFHCGKPPDCTTQLQKVVAAGDPYKLQRQGWHPPTCPVTQPVQPTDPASCQSVGTTNMVINYLSGACDEYNKQMRSYKQQLQDWERQCSDEQFRDYQQRAADMRANPRNYVSDPRCKQAQGPTG